MCGNIQFTKAVSILVLGVRRQSTNQILLYAAHLH